MANGKVRGKARLYLLPAFGRSGDWDNRAKQVKRLLRPYLSNPNDMHDMTFNPDIHHRRSIRLKDHDYSQPGAYFVTICTYQRECLLGEIIDGKMQLNDIGLRVAESWCALADHFPRLALDGYVVMPNHLHGIVLLADLAVGAKQGVSASPSLASPLRLPVLQGTVPGSLAAIVQNFKSVSTRRINKIHQQAGLPLWQRNYFEHVIRSERELDRAREYIANNPMKWQLDKENPANLGL